MNNHQINRVSFSLPQGEVHGLSYGDPQHDVVLCLHGWLDNAASFYPLMPHIKNKYVIAIDWPGHGLSFHRSDDCHYNFIDWVDDLYTLCKAQHWQKVDIIAHSMGAMVAQAFAGAFPEKVQTLTLLDALGFITAAESRTDEQLRQGILSRHKQKAKRQQSFPEKTFSLEQAINARMMASGLAEGLAKLLVKRSIIKKAQGYRWRTDRRLREVSPQRYSRAQGQRLICAIKAPVLLIRASKGLDMIEQALVDYQHLFQQLTVHTFEGEHHLHMENPEKISTLINRFLLCHG